MHAIVWRQCVVPGWLSYRASIAVSSSTSSSSHVIWQLLQWHVIVQYSRRARRRCDANITGLHDLRSEVIGRSHSATQQRVQQIWIWMDTHRQWSTVARTGGRHNDCVYLTTDLVHGVYKYIAMTSRCWQARQTTDDHVISVNLPTDHGLTATTSDQPTQPHVARSIDGRMDSHSGRSSSTGDSVFVRLRRRDRQWRQRWGDGVTSRRRRSCSSRPIIHETRRRRRRLTSSFNWSVTSSSRSHVQFV